MAISRRLPNSDRQRMIFLRESKTKKDGLSPAQVANVLRTNTATDLDTHFAAYNTAYTARTNALASQVGATQQVNDLAKKLKMMCSHYLQILKFRVERGAEPAYYLQFYALAASNPVLPAMGTEAELRDVASRILSGDVARIAAGGAAMVEITAQQIQTAYDDWTAATVAQSNLKDAYNAAQEAIATMNPTIDIFVRKLYDEIESAYNSNDTASNRRNAREWGVIYVTDTPTAVVEGTITDATTSQPIGQVAVINVETEEITYTGADGKYLLRSVFIGDALITTQKVGYETAEQSVVLDENVHKTLDFVLREGV